ncbi:MAG TPA: hypothetical protein VGQ83_06205 [Polyangia bacterium]
MAVGGLCPVCEQAAAPGAAGCGQCGGALALNGRWVLDRLLGSGGQSRVFAAHDQRDGAAVAVKIMSLARAHDLSYLKERAEARGISVGDLVNDLLKRDIGLIEAGK